MCVSRPWVRRLAVISPQSLAGAALVAKLPTIPYTPKIDNRAKGEFPKMKSKIATIVAAMMLAVPSVQAQDHDTKTIPVAYFSIPFGDVQQESVPVFGFKVTQTSTDSQGGINLLHNHRPALMDYQIKNGEAHAFTVNGFNALKKTHVVYANGTSKIENALDWKVLVPAGLFGGYFLIKVTEGEGGGDDCPPRRKRVKKVYGFEDRCRILDD